MTEYATTPSAIEEWNTIRSRTATWVEKSLPPQLCYRPSQSLSEDSDNDQRSLWDGGGWEPPSDCESATSLPPTMVLKYGDDRKVLITPTHSENTSMATRGSKTRTRKTVTATGTDKDGSRVIGAGGDEAATEKAYSQAGNPPPKSAPVAATSSAVSGPAKVAVSQQSKPAAVRKERAPSATQIQSQPQSRTQTQTAKQSTAKGTEVARSGGVESKKSSARNATAGPATPSAPASAGPPASVAPVAPSVQIQNQDQSKPATSHSASAALVVPDPVIPSKRSSQAPSHVPSPTPNQHEVSRSLSRSPERSPSPKPPSTTTIPPTTMMVQDQVPASQNPSQKPASSRKTASHIPSHAPSQARTVQKSHQPSVAPSNHTTNSGPRAVEVAVSASAPVPPSSFIHPAPALADSVDGTGGSNGGNPSIHSRSMSHSDSRSSGPPEAITIHPPTASINSGKVPTSRSNALSYVTTPHGGGEQGHEKEIAVSPSAHASIYQHPPSHSHSAQNQPSYNVQPSLRSSGTGVASGAVAVAGTSPRRERRHERPQRRDPHYEGGAPIETPKLHVQTPSLTPTYHSNGRSHHQAHPHQQPHSQQHSHRSQYTQYNPLPTPISATHSQNPSQGHSQMEAGSPKDLNLNANYMVHPGRALSNMSTVGLDGGYVLVDAVDYNLEGGEGGSELMNWDKKKGSLGSRSGIGGDKERGSLLSVFGVGSKSRFGHSRSRSLGQSTSGEGATAENPTPGGLPLDTIPGSPVSYHSRGGPPLSGLPVNGHRAHKSQPAFIGGGSGVYPTPVSPTNPNSFNNPEGPHPPSIVYAPAKHGRVSQFSPPRIMYMPSSPKGPGEGSANIGTMIRDSGWGDATSVSMASGSGQSMHAHQPIVARDFAHGVGGAGAEYAQNVADVNPGVKVSYGGGSVSGGGGEGVIAVDKAIHDPVSTSPRSHKSHHSHSHSHSQHSQHSQSHHSPSQHSQTHVYSPQHPLVHSNSDATSTRTNLAGLGTHPANRSRSRSRARAQAGGIAYSSSAPQATSASLGARPGDTVILPHHQLGPSPNGHGPTGTPYAAMMLPPGSSYTNERGVRDTPYPTPPGSATEPHPTPAEVITAATAAAASSSTHAGTYPYRERDRERDRERRRERERRRKERPESVRSVPLQGVYARGDGLADVDIVSPREDLSGAPLYSPRHGEGMEREPRLGTKNLMSRFRDIYQYPRDAHHPQHPDQPYPAQTDEPRRGRTGRRGRKIYADVDGDVRNGKEREGSVGSERSISSGSTYYVISNPGQKVRIIRTDGTSVTQDTSLSRHASNAQTPSGGRIGWFKKAKEAAKFRSRRTGGGGDIIVGEPLTGPDIIPQDELHVPGERRAPSQMSRATNGTNGTNLTTGTHATNGTHTTNGTEKEKRRRNKLVRRNSTGSSALLAMGMSMEDSAGVSLGGVIGGGDEVDGGDEEM